MDFLIKLCYILLMKCYVSIKQTTKDVELYLKYNVNGERIKIYVHYNN